MAASPPKTFFIFDAWIVIVEDKLSKIAFLNYGIISVAQIGRGRRIPPTQKLRGKEKRRKRRGNGKTEERRGAMKKKKKRKKKERKMKRK